MSDEELNDSPEFEIDGPAEEAAATIEAEAQPEVEVAPSEDQPAEKPKLNGWEKRIAKLSHREKMKEQENAQLKAELETYKAMQTKAEPEAAPEFPSDDLRYDNVEEYRQKLDAYNRYVARQEFNSLQQQQQETLKQREAEEQNRAKQAEYGAIVENYIEGGLKSGISTERMEANEQILKGANLPQDILKRIYSDEYGAKVVDHIVSNDGLLKEISAMNPYDAAIKIATEIKPSALSSKPLSTNAPDPVAPTQGGGVPPSDEWSQMTEGMTFE